MTNAVATSPLPTHRGASARRAAPTVEVLLCGSIDRGDDAAPVAACDLLESDLPTNARIRRVGQLDVDDLLSIPREAGVVIVDAATGIDPGATLELPLRGLLGDAPVRARSSHALAMPEVIGLADMLRGRPLTGRIVVIGGRRFRLGQPLSRPVAAALRALSRAISLAVQRVTDALLEQEDEPLRVRSR